MASRAHAIHDYSFGGARSHRRRQLWFRADDPIKLPKNSLWAAGIGALATAVATAAIVAAGAYAVSHAAPVRLSETPTLAPIENWQPDLGLVDQAAVVNLLQGPALAVPDKAQLPLDKVDEPAAASTSPDSREVIIDDSKLYPLDESKRYPRTAPPEELPAPYPNPTTTPPDAIAPPGTVAPPVMTPAEPTPSLERDNPYRDGV